MSGLLSELDALLRGRLTGERGPPPSLRRLLPAGLLCGALAGAGMGVYSAVRGGAGSELQVLSSALKVPLLFLLTLLVTSPSLYVFSALAGSRLSPTGTLRLLLAAVVVDLALLASLAPIVVFFTVFTKSYAFISLLDVGFFVLAGGVSLGFLARALRPMFGGPEEPGSAPAAAPVADVERSLRRAEATAEAAGSLRRARTVFRTWLVVYGFVGAQMGWVLRPFVGNPEMEFVWFRHRGESNVLAAVANLLRDLLGAW